jgi:hypothetical protein
MISAILIVYFFMQIYNKIKLISEINNYYLYLISVLEEENNAC